MKKPEDALQKAEDLYRKGEFSRALALYETLLDELPEDAANDSRRARALRRAGDCQIRLGRYEEAGRRLTLARKAAGDGPERFAVAGSMAVLLVNEGRYGEAAELIGGVIEAPELPAAEAAPLHQILGLVRFHEGAYREATRSYKRAVKLYEKTGDLRGLAGCHQNLALCRQQLFETDQAIEHYKEAIRICREIGDESALALGYANLGALYLSRPSYGEALEHFEEARRIMGRLGTAPYAAAVTSNLGNLYLKLGDLDRARGFIEEADRLAEELKLPLYRGFNAVLLAELALLEGRAGEAKELYEKGLSVFQSVGSHKELLSARLGFLDILLEDGDEEEIRRHLKISAEMADRLKSEHHRNLLLLAAAKADLLFGDAADLARSRKALEGALEHFEKAGFIEHLWQGYRLLGRLAGKLGEEAEARRLQVRAADLLESIAATAPEEFRESFRTRGPMARWFAEAGGASSEKTRDFLLRILQTNKLLNTERSLDRCLDLILDNAMGLSMADRGLLFLDGEVKVSRGIFPEELTEGEMTEISALAEEAAREGKSRLHFLSGEGEEPSTGMVERLKVVSIMVLPIRSKKGVLGALYLDNRYHRGAFRESTLSLVEAFCDQAGIAVENGRLYEELLAAQAVLEKENLYLREEVGLEFRELVGRAPAFLEAVETIRRAAPTEATVLIRGETGTGKELMAHMLHDLSPRLNRAMVKSHLAAVPESLMESELFGHERGAFTGAIEQRIGKFELADGGTLFLDEIGDISEATQVKLLRVLQEREFTRLGGGSVVRVDVRLIAATNRDLEKAVREGKFREDLFYRLNVVPVRLPPLRERREDIAELARYFMKKHSRSMGRRFEKIGEESLRRLEGYAWPGNVRELENVIQRAMVQGKGRVLDIGDIAPAAPLCVESFDRAAERSFDDSVDDYKRNILEEAIRAAGGNKSRAAESLGVSRTRLYKIMASLGMETKDR